jgi:hypothetical protein
MRDTIKRIFDVLFQESEILSKQVSPVKPEDDKQEKVQVAEDIKKEKDKLNAKYLIYLVYFLLILIFILLTLFLF